MKMTLTDSLLPTFIIFFSLFGREHAVCGDVTVPFSPLFFSYPPPLLIFVVDLLGQIWIEERERDHFRLE